MPEKQPAQSMPTAASDADKARARQWFKKATDMRDRHEYDYAIECYITGLGYWPEAVEEGHMPLRSLAVQRQQAGGKKPGMMDGMRKSMTAKDVKVAMLNAEHLLSMDPMNATYAEGLLKNAVKGGFLDTVKWVAPVVLDALRREPKINKPKFAAYREALLAAVAIANERQESALETFLLDQAAQSLDFQVARTPGDDSLKDELKHLAGRLTIARGKYDQADSFRDSIRDADKQKLLHDAERMRQGGDTLEALISSARRDYEENPGVTAKLNAYIDALSKADRNEEDGIAVDVLMGLYAKSKNYSLKTRADDLRLRSLKRTLEALHAKAKATHAADDKQQVRLAQMELRQETIAVYRERVEQYPTDLRMKFLLARALFESGEYDEAIPVLQIAQQDPRTRVRCQLMLGRSFFEKGNFPQAAAVLGEASEKYDVADDSSKGLLYWHARALEAGGRTAEAKDVYGKLLRQEYNYLDGEARKRLEALQ